MIGRPGLLLIPSAGALGLALAFKETFMTSCLDLERASHVFPLMAHPGHKENKERMAEPLPLGVSMTFSNTAHGCPVLCRNMVVSRTV